MISPRFEAAAVMSAIERDEVTNVWLAPTMVNAKFRFLLPTIPAYHPRRAEAP